MNFYFKRFFILISLIFLCSGLMAEEGELQLNFGGGAFFPLSLKTEDKTVLVFASWNAGMNIYFGLTDELDIGTQVTFTMLSDASRKAEFLNMQGTEYFNYWRVQHLVLLRYNLFPGLFFSPHVIAGGGYKVETFEKWDFYGETGKINNYSKSDYVSANGVVAVGIDLQFRVWEWFIISTQTLYKWSPDDHSFDLNLFLGATFFVNYYR